MKSTSCYSICTPVSFENSVLTMDISHNGNINNGDSVSTAPGIEEIDFSKFTDKPRTLNTERQRSYDERSLSELSIGLSPHHTLRNVEYSRNLDQVDCTFSPGRRSGFNTPWSQNSYEPHPSLAEAWEALRRSLVYFRGQPVGTIAALDNSDEKLNYDQVNIVNSC